MKKRKPIILISSFRDTPKNDVHLERNGANRAIIESILDAGGLPLIFPLHTDTKDIEQVTEIADGLLIPGGEDIHPKFFSKTEKIHKTVNCLSEDRDQMEIQLVNHFHKKQTPILGICRGVQIVNVALGGDIFQDITSDLKTSIIHHPDFNNLRLGDFSRIIHTVIIDPKTVLKKLFKKGSIRVNSIHHQAIRHIAPPLMVNARSEDGIIEGVESQDMHKRWVMGVQWHPEIIRNSHPENKKLFRAFILACMK